MPELLGYASAIALTTHPLVSKENTFYVHLLVESFCVVFQKHFLKQGIRPSLVLNLFLSFHQISGSCSYKFFLNEKESVLPFPKLCLTNPISLTKSALNSKKFKNVIWEYTFFIRSYFISNLALDSLKFKKLLEVHGKSHRK